MLRPVAANLATVRDRAVLQAGLLPSGGMPPQRAPFGLVKTGAASGLCRDERAAIGGPRAFPARRPPWMMRFTVAELSPLLYRPVCISRMSLARIEATAASRASPSRWCVRREGLDDLHVAL